MKIIMLMVASLNGKTTKDEGPNIYTWTSKEDQKLFFSTINKHNLIVMGRKTYEAAKEIMKLSRDKLRLVLTRNPKKYKSKEKKGILEFTDESPKVLVKRLKAKGYKTMLLVGGAAINSMFLKESMVDELFLTIEPKIFGNGQSFVIEESLNIRLKLIEIKKLNKQGTLYLRYRVQGLH